MVSIDDFISSKKMLKPRLLIPLTILLLLPATISFYSTYLRYIERLNVYESNAPDLNMEVVISILQGYNGLTYFFEFLFNSESILFFCLFLATAVMLFIGSAIVEELTNGNGALILSRTKYKKYLLGNLLAQIIFIFGYLTIFFTFLFLGSYLFFSPLDLPYGVNTIHNNMHIEKEASLFPYMGIMFLQLLNMTMVISTMTLVGSLLVVFIRNKYIIQMFPLLYFITSLVVAGSIGNLIVETGPILSIFVLERQISAIVYGYFTAYKFIFSITNFSDSFFYIISFSVIIFILYKQNLKKFGRDYIL